MTPFEYDNEFYDPLGPEQKPPPPAIDENRFSQWLAGNSVARSAEGRKNIARKEIERRQTIPKSDPFVLADAVSGKMIPEVEGQKSMTGAYYELWKLQKLEPLRKMNVVRASELLT